jgi:ADP-ribosylglycohydrolase
MALRPLPPNYAERVYAGVLGKMIGVYLGRPFEGWSYEQITQRVGEITHYMHEQRGMPLLVTDDDLSGTFTFVRALQDYGYDPALTAEQIGQTWLNYIIEGRTILWWGGMGNSTEHTAYLRLKKGIKAPASGSRATNGKVVSEQIGAQIFIDGWAMLCPGDPERAADFARRAASVSHDGEAIYAAQVLCAMEAQAFVEPDINRLLDIGTAFIPHDAVIYRLIQDIRGWHQQESDWRETRKKIERYYGYTLYGGNCHVVPNHALIILALLYGQDDFSTSLTIVNTAGWDTDCNSGNVGCLLGIKKGLRGLHGGPDWRGPVADRLYLPTADGGRAITDALTESYQLIRATHALQGVPFVAPKQGARFHFSLPGSVQGFRLMQDEHTPADTCIENTVCPQYVLQGTLQGAPQSTLQGVPERVLAIRYPSIASEQHVRVATPTFVPPEAINMPVYDLLASPTLYPGQVVRANVVADPENTEPVCVHLSIQMYVGNDGLDGVYSPATTLRPGQVATLTWRIPDTCGQPIATIGLALAASSAPGSVYLDSLDWDGAPEIMLTRPQEGGSMWRRAWVNAVDVFDDWGTEAYRLVQNNGSGMVIQGTREWTNYTVSALVTPHAVQAAGIAVRVQGLQRYYALMLLETGHARFLKMLDGEQVLREVLWPWELDRTYAVRLELIDAYIRAWIDEQLLFEYRDDKPFAGGGIALICQEGRVAFDMVSVRPSKHGA